MKWVLARLSIVVGSALALGPDAHSSPVVETGRWVVVDAPEPAKGDEMESDEDTLFPATYAWVHAIAGTAGEDTVKLSEQANSALESTAAQAAAVGHEYKAWHWEGPKSGHF